MERPLVDAMNWFANHRQEWIAESLRVYGYINREHLMIKFGISMPQASADLQQFLRDRPGVMRYDSSMKKYLAIC